MEKKVIKFNLVGAIFVLILIIAIITFIVSFIFKGNKEENSTIKNDAENNKEAVENDVSSEENNTEIDEQKEYTEKVFVNGSEQEITMKMCKGTFGYTMKYDVNSFYVQKNINNADKFNSLYSDTISIFIKEEAGDFRIVIQEIFKNGSKSDNGEIINVSEQLVNGMYSVRKIIKNDREISYIYYIEKSNESYFTIEVKCGTGFENMILPIVEKMLDSFEIYTF